MGRGCGRKPGTDGSTQREAGSPFWKQKGFAIQSKSPLKSKPGIFPDLFLDIDVLVGHNSIAETVDLRGHRPVWLGASSFLSLSGHQLTPLRSVPREHPKDWTLPWALGWKAPLLSKTVIKNCWNSRHSGARL